MRNDTSKQAGAHVERSGIRYPVATVIEVRVWQGHRQFRVLCPYCGEIHLQGAGKVGEGVEDYRGHRNSHCLSDRPEDVGYFIGECSVVGGKAA